MNGIPAKEDSNETDISRQLKLLELEWKTKKSN